MQKKFTGRILISLLPLIAAGVVTFLAWQNTGTVPVLADPPEFAKQADAKLNRYIDFRAAAPVISRSAVEEAGRNWFTSRMKLARQDAESQCAAEALDEAVNGLNGRVRLNFQLPANTTASDAEALARYVNSQINPSPRYRFNLGVDLAGGTVLVYEVAEKPDKNFQSAELAAALKRRIDPANLMEITIRPIETDPPRVEIVLPMKPGGQGAADIERVRSVVRQVGKLEFRILASTEKPRPPATGESDASAIDAARTAVQGFEPTSAEVPPSPDPERYEWVELAENAVKEAKSFQGRPAGFDPISTYAMFHAPKVNRHFVLTKIPREEEVVTGEDLASAIADVSQNMKWEVRFSLKASGADRFWRLTEPVGHYMAIILDKKVTSYPTLLARLRDGGVITMGNDPDTKKRVEELVLILRSGALPATLNPNPVSELTMGPGLGQDTINKGALSVAIAFVGVVLFMLFYYHLAGAVASVALFANLLLTIGFMVFVKAAFTLPGLAGLVLMLGMAVDANVLIYERIREERERGASLALAIRQGYDRAFPTIIDTHLTSIFTAIVLYVVGSDNLKGFGISLTVGLIISLFTALYMTRLMFDLLLARNLIGDLKMVNFVHWALKTFRTNPEINFMAWRRFWFTTTVALSVVGLFVFLLRGEQGLNIDFTGGTAYSVEFKEPKSIDDVRDRLRKANDAAPEADRLPEPSVDAIYRSGEGEAGLTRFYTFRTAVRDRTEEEKKQGRSVHRVRAAIAGIFGEELRWVDVKAGQLQQDGETRKVDFTFTNKAVTPQEVARIVDAWYAAKGENKPSDFYTVRTAAQNIAPGETPSSTVEVAFRLPVTFPREVEPQLIQTITTELRQPVSDRLENFDSGLAAETQGRALAAIALSWLAISLYLWFRFGNWTFGTAAVLCLIHDLTFTLGLIGLSHYLIQYVPLLANLLALEDFKLDLTAVAALLTLVGYSVNDTIVVFDRIREVRGKSPELTPKMINDSVNQTLSRTLLTSVTVFIVVLIQYVLGGEGIHLFAFVMLWGVIVGTYSSIFVASPLLLWLGEGQVQERRGGRVQPAEARA